MNYLLDFAYTFFESGSRIRESDAWFMFLVKLIMYQTIQWGVSNELISHYIQV